MGNSKLCETVFLRKGMNLKGHELNISHVT